MKSRTLVGGIFALFWLTALPAWAVEYRLQVANIDDETFASYEGKASSWTSMKEPMGRLEARLDDNHFSRAAILPGHHVELVQDPAYGGMTPTNVSRLPATRHQDWSTYVFDANPGDTVVFVVRTDMVAWQQAEDVASDVKGTFRRLSIRHSAVPRANWSNFGRSVESPLGRRTPCHTPIGVKSSIILALSRACSMHSASVRSLTALPNKIQQRGW
jgi:hypothetical protein